MSAELERLNHRIRTRKKSLRKEIKAGRVKASALWRKLQKKQANNESYLHIKIDYQVEHARLNRRHFALRELVDLTRRNAKL